MMTSCLKLPGILHSLRDLHRKDRFDLELLVLAARELLPLEMNNIVFQSRQMSFGNKVRDIYSKFYVQY